MTEREAWELWFYLGEERGDEWALCDWTADMDEAQLSMEMETRLRLFTPTNKTCASFWWDHPDYWENHDPARATAVCFLMAMAP